MFVAALVILVIAVLMIVAAVLGGGDPTTVDLGAFNLETNAASVFFLGMAALLLLVLSAVLFRSAARRASARRSDRRRVGELSSKLDAYEREEHRTGDQSRQGRPGRQVREDER